MKRAMLLSAVGALALALSLAPSVWTTACADEPIVLKYADPSRLGQPRTLATKDTLDEIERRSGGRIKHELYWAGSLMKAKDILKGIQAGTCDVGMPLAVAYHASRLQAWQFTQLLFTVGDDYFAVTKACNEMYETNSVLKKEADKQALLLSTTGCTSAVIMCKKPIHKLEDFKGLKLKTTGYASNWLASLGAVVSPMSIYEVSEALARGVLDGTKAYPYLIHSFKFDEYCKYLPMDGIDHIIVEYWMNPNSFKRMPADLQKIYLDTWRNYYPERMAKHMDEQIKNQLAAAKELGVKIYRIDPAELKRWKQTAEKANERYFNQMEKMGVDGRQLVADYQALYKKYERKK